ncbi:MULTISPECIES: TolC family protein [unclassified Methylophaga]|uniref:TolC family protein n=1 Tax=unclassified Methylophaga TaxID=2629249 RepID=UPI000C940DF4|nr:MULTISPECIES: TolC family protein [unclassified Methylophaga]MAK67211.1 RND transporter [Methylophaga sp.]MAY18249.1 RND transporter [Methylophaga sp.]HAO24777.1 RND transporter [Methylophaga sp.]
MSNINPDRYLKKLAYLPLLMLSACSITPEQPDYVELISVEQQRVNEWQNLSQQTHVAYLNDLVDSDMFDELLKIAMQSNPDLQQMLLTLQIRQSQRIQASGEKRPFISAGASAQNSSDSDTRFGADLSISWQADLWGKLADNERAADLDITEQSLLYQSARDTLAAEVMQVWLTLIAQQRALDIEQQRQASLQQTEFFILQRYRQGLGTLEDLDSARSAVASSSADIEALTQSFRQQTIQLKTLVGQVNNPEFTLPADYPDVVIPAIDLPEQTLNRRPDLRAAYAAIQASSARTEVAYKDLLPSLSLQAVLEDVGSSPRASLFTAPVWSLLGQLTAPLYQGGQLRAEAEIRELETAISYQQYRDTLLNAVTEIEQALSQEQALVKQQQHIETALASAENNLRQYQANYRSGLLTILDLLTVQQQTYNLQAQLDDLIYQRLLNRISLGLALGLEAKA